MSFEKKKVAVNNQTFLTLVNTGISEDDVVKQAQEIKKLQPEMMEWRIDYFEDVVLMNRLLEVAGKVKTVMDKTPVLITFRSKNSAVKLNWIVKTHI
ncbi:hypothetical protein LBGG_00447 [Lactobacillus gasseri MV-22]|nr:hypothetical protein LBGG_00447 [Lactobacillus gasseri MV-22]